MSERMAHFLKELEVKASVTVGVTEEQPTKSTTALAPNKKSHRWKAGAPAGSSTIWNGQWVLGEFAKTEKRDPNTPLPILSKDGSTALIPIYLSIDPEPREHDASDRLHIVVSLTSRPLAPTRPADQLPPIGPDQELIDIFKNVLKHDETAESDFMGSSMVMIPTIPTKPMRRTFSKSFPVFTALTLQAETSSLAYSHPMDRFFLRLEFENTAGSPLVVFELHSVEVSIHGAMASRMTHIKESFPIQLRSRDVYGLLYTVTFLDPISENAATPCAIAEPLQLDNHPIMLKASGQLRFYDAATGELLGSKEHSSGWCARVCSLNGVLDVYHGEDQIGNYHQSLLALPRHGEYLSVRLAVQGDVVLHRQVTVQVVLGNRTQRTLNLALVIPNSEESQRFLSGAQTTDETDSYANRNKDLVMDPITFLRLYDAHQRKGSSFVCLENNLRVPAIEPDTSVMVELTFIPIRGEGSVQRIEYLQCVDRDTGVISELNNVLELFVKRPESVGQ